MSLGFFVHKNLAKRQTWLKIKDPFILSVGSNKRCESCYTWTAWTCDPDRDSLVEFSLPSEMLLRTLTGPVVCPDEDEEGEGLIRGVPATPGAPDPRFFGEGDLVMARSSAGEMPEKRSKG